jgi:hypothetical protein
MGWLILAIFIGLSLFCIYLDQSKKFSKDILLSLSIGIPIIILFIGMMVSLLTYMGNTNNCIIKDKTIYSFTDDQVHIVTINPYKHVIIIIDIKRDSKEYSYIIEQLPIKYNNPDKLGIYHIVLTNYIPNYKNYWAYSFILPNPCIKPTIEIYPGK